MVSILILLPILLSVYAVSARSVSSSEKSIYIGSFDNNDYYVSANSAMWSSAEIDCRNQLGGSLLAVETEAEWEFLEVALESFGFGTSYWTSGMYDPSRSTWRWTQNDVALAAWAPWAPGFPSNPNQLLRINIYFTNRYNALWQTIPNTQLHRYICELNH